MRCETLVHVPTQACTEYGTPPICTTIKKRGCIQSVISGLRPRLDQTAQQVYDSWEWDENGFRYEYGGGGICDEIAEKLADKILNTFSEMGIDVEITSGCQDGDDHAWIVVYSQDDAWGVDIPPGSMRSAADITGKRSQM